MFAVRHKQFWVEIPHILKYSFTGSKASDATLQFGDIEAYLLFTPLLARVPDDPT